MIPGVRLRHELRRLGGAVLLGACLAACGGTRPADLGAENGRLRPCPGTPNCVSSQSDAPEARVAALPYGARAPEQARADLGRILAAWPRTTVVRRDRGYWHAECASAFWGFVDDVEFLFDDTQGRIDVRSGARLGYSDLGVNRRRIDRLREAWMREDQGLTEH